MTSGRWLAVGVAGWVAVWGTAAGRLPPGGQADNGLLLRMTADSGAVGSYRFTVQEATRLTFELPEDDPRVAALRSVTEPRQRTTDLAATLVSMPKAPEEERRYLVYWLGYRTGGSELPGLSALQWDSIFQKVGRRAAVRISPLGQPRGVEVVAEATRPVARAFGEIVSALPLDLPMQRVTAGDRWEGRVLVPVDAPDGTRESVVTEVTYRLREVESNDREQRVRIEFDGRPMGLAAGTGTVDGRYFGESVFSVQGGRYEQIVVTAELEVSWPDGGGGLPPSRTVAEWQAAVSRN